MPGHGMLPNTSRPTSRPGGPASACHLLAAHYCTNWSAGRPVSDDPSNLIHQTGRERTRAATLQLSRCLGDSHWRARAARSVARSEGTGSRPCRMSSFTWAKWSLEEAGCRRIGGKGAGVQEDRITGQFLPGGRTGIW